MFLIFLFFSGLIVGSFANVCIVRMPEDESVIWPGSHCRSCKALLRWYDNIPVASWLVLRGRCRDCQEPIPARYPFVELGTAGLFVVLGTLGFPPRELTVYLVLTAALMVITVIDFDHFIIPDLISIPLILISPGLAVVVGHITLRESMTGIVLGGGILWTFAAVYEFVRKQEGMGFGDVKLVAMIGGFVGVSGALFTIMFGALSGSIIGALMMGLRRGRLDTEIPFGPFLAAGGYVYILAGPAIIDWYLTRTNFFG
ncbi:MAG: leader peptidase (prepilin peptidase)/N-methyltransferase [Hyphomicrobiaceae bacterium]|jgi:leader peptidase (prepilin peptidase)/N-methyltransferase